MPTVAKSLASDLLVVGTSNVVIPWPSMTSGLALPKSTTVERTYDVTVQVKFKVSYKAGSVAVRCYVEFTDLSNKIWRTDETVWVPTQSQSPALVTLTLIAPLVIPKATAAGDHTLAIRVRSDQTTAGNRPDVLGSTSQGANVTFAIAEAP